MKKFQNKYRIENSRLKNWDYGKNASYFVTICIHNREKLFGEIVEDKMIMNELGKIVDEIFGLKFQKNLILQNYKTKLKNHF